MSELYIRPTLNDHNVIADLLATPPVATLHRLRPPISGLVLDATVTTHRTQFRVFSEAATDRGVPLLLDPLTYLLQSNVDPADAWATLPFGVAPPVAIVDMNVAAVVEQVVQHQLEAGATKIVAPYLYAAGPDDPAYAVSLQMLTATVEYLRAEGLHMPVVAVFAGQLQGFGQASAVIAGIGRYVSVVDDLDVTTLGLALSPLGDGKDSYRKLSMMMRVVTAAATSRAAVIAWRQGIYGPLLTAAGLDGYECGIASSESSNVSRLQSARRPKPADASPPRNGGGMYLEPIGRSVPTKVGQLLLENPQLRGELLCNDETCCRDVEAQRTHRREHAVRSRARFLATLRDLPRASWRLNHIAQHSAHASIVARHINDVLGDSEFKQRIQTTNLAAIERIATELSQAPARRSA